MLRIDYAAQTYAIRHRLLEHNYFFEMLQMLTEHQESIDAIHNNLAIDDAGVRHEASDKIMRAYKGVKSLMPRLKGSKFSREADQINAVLSEAGDPFDVRMNVVELLDALDAYNSSHKPEDAEPLLKRAQTVKRKIHEWLNLSATIAGMLLPPLASSEEELITFTLPGDHALPEVVEKLNVLQSILDWMDELLKGQGVRTDFRLLRIESGSLVLTVIGAKAAIAFFRAISERAIAYGYRNFTKEGRKTDGLKIEVAGLHELQKLLDSNRKRGIPTEQLEQILQNGAEVVADRYVSLCMGKDYVIVDNKVIRRDRHQGQNAPLLQYEDPPRLSAPSTPGDNGVAETE